MNILDSVKEASQIAQQQAQEKQLRAAVTTAETGLKLWTEQVGLWEKVWGKLAIGNLVESLEKQLIEWRKQVHQADQLLNQARQILANDNKDPLDTKAITNAIALYHLYTQIIVDQQGADFISQCQQELVNKQKYQSLIKQGKEKAEKLYLKQAIAIYKSAEKLYPIDAIKPGIIELQKRVYQEENYNFTA